MPQMNDNWRAQEERARHEQMMQYSQHSGEIIIGGIPFGRDDAIILKDLVEKIKHKLPGDPTVYPKEMDDAINDAVKELGGTDDKEREGRLERQIRQGQAYGGTVSQQAARTQAVRASGAL